MPVLRMTTRRWMILAALVAALAASWVQAQGRSGTLLFGVPTGLRWSGTKKEGFFPALLF